MEILMMVLATLAAMAIQTTAAGLTLMLLVNLIPTMNGVKAKRTKPRKRPSTSPRSD